MYHIGKLKNNKYERNKMLIQQMGGKNALQEAVVSPLEQNG
jgi:hypothetical protein